MKKALVLIVPIIILMSCLSAYAAYNEPILFRNIPWEYSINDFASVVWDDISSYRDDSSGLIKDNMLVLPPSDELISFPVPGEVFDKVTDIKYDWYSSIIFADDDIQVGGYQIKWVRINALPKLDSGKVMDGPENTTVYAATYLFECEGIDVLVSGNDLCEQLTAIYGKPDQKSYRNGIFLSTWLGQNNTFVQIRFYDDDYTDLSIVYGRTDTEETIEKLNNATPVSSSNGL